jgi:hypothetical protein
MAVWLAAGSVGATVGVWSWLETGDARGLLAVLLPLSGCGLIVIGFVPERRKAVKLLGEVFETTSHRPLASRSGASEPS